MLISCRSCELEELQCILFCEPYMSIDSFKRTQKSSFCNDLFSETKKSKLIYDWDLQCGCQHVTLCK